MTLETALQELMSAVIANLLQLLTVLIGAAIVALTPVVRQWVLQQVALVRSKVSAEHLAILDLIVERAVQTVEQSAAVGLILKDGQAKKAAAISIVQDELNRRGIPFNLTEAANRIEAAINQGLEQPNAALAIAEKIELPERSAQYQ